MGFRLGQGVGLATGGGVPAPFEGFEFFAESGATHPSYVTIHPANLYLPNLDAVLSAWEAWSADFARREIHGKLWDRATDTFSAEFVIGTTTMTNDDHGTPTLALLDDGRVMCGYGCHVSALRLAVTVDADNPFVWRDLASLGTAITYPKLLNVGGVIHLICRDGPNLSLQHYRTTAIAGDGTPTWSAATNLADFTAANDIYPGTCQLRGVDKIHIVATNRISATSQRTHLYKFILDTTTLDVANSAGDHTALAANHPIDKTEADASFRLFETTGANEAGNGMYEHFDAAGNNHIAFRDGSAGAGNFMHIMSSDGGVTYSAPFQVAGSISALENAIIARHADGIQYVYAPGNDVKRRVRETAGTWRAEETIRLAGALGTEDLSMLNNLRGLDTEPKFRFSYYDSAPDDLDASAGGRKGFIHGDSGPLLRRPRVYTPVNAEASAYIARLAVQPSSDRKELIDRIFSVLKSVGLAKFHFLHAVPLAESQADSLLNLVHASDYPLEPVGGVTYSAATKRWTGNGVDGKLRIVGYNPSLVAASQLNSAHLAIRTHVAAASTASAIGGSDGTTAQIISPSTGTNLAARLNSAGNTNFANTNTAGYFGINRSASNALQLQRNGVEVATGVTASAAKPNRELAVLSITDVSFSDNSFSIAHGGTSLTAAEWLKLHSLWLWVLRQFLVL